MTVGVGYHFWDVKQSDWIVDYQIVSLAPQTVMYCLTPLRR